MITLSPISKTVQETLNKKISMLKKSSAGSISDGEEPEFKGPSYQIGTAITDEKGEAPQNFMMTRSPFIKMTSFVPKRALGLSDPLSAVILMGGNLDMYHNMMGGFGDTHGSSWKTDNGDFGGNFNTQAPIGSSGDYDWIDNPHFRPQIAGIKDISVEYKGGGINFGAHRTADINWTCWTWEQVEEYQSHFLKHGNTILLEWGWSGIGDLQDVQTVDIYKTEQSGALRFPIPIFDFDKFNDKGKFESLYDKIIDHTNKQNGNYDSMLGIITDFEYSVNDTGGFDCSTTLVASGITMLNRRKSYNIIDKFSELPALVRTEDEMVKLGVLDAVKNWIDIFNHGKHLYKGSVLRGDEYKAGQKVVSIVSDKTPSELAPYVTFKDYMQNLHRECLAQVLQNTGRVEFDKDIPGRSPQIMITTNIDGYKVWTVGRSEVAEDFGIGTDDNFTARQTVIDPNMVKMLKREMEKSKEGGTAIEVQVEDESGNLVDGFLVGNLVPVANTKKKKEEQFDPLKRFVASVPYDLDPKYSSDLPQSEKLKTAVGTYITWGWFEDNVLSRFFGDIQEGIQGNSSSTFTEFRSIERLTNDAGEFVEWEDTRDGGSQIKPVYIPTKMYNSIYLMTTDTSKWIIPNLSDPIASNLNFEYDWAKGEEDISTTNRKIDENGGSLLSDTIGKAKLHQGRNWLKHYFDTDNFKVRNTEEVTMKNVAQMSKSNKDEMCIRNILFNTEFLKKHFTSAEEIIKGVQGVWDEFATEYGDVYKFVIDYDEEGNRIKVREEGFTDVPMDELLEGRDIKLQGGSADGKPPLFVFPTWEDGSIVKSQTINAKLPTRMQQQAMYNNSATKYGDGIMNSSYSEVAARAWGKISGETVDGDTLLTEEQKKFNHYADLMSGQIDYPSRGNRGFGSMTADIQLPLHVGETVGWDKNKKQYETAHVSPDPGRGTQISSTIKQAIDPQIKKYAEERTNALAGTDRKYTSNADDSKLESFMLQSALTRVNASGTKFMITGWASPFNPEATDKRGVFLTSEHNWSIFYTFHENKDLEVNNAWVKTTYYDDYDDSEIGVNLTEEELAGVPSTTQTWTQTESGGMEKIPAGNFKLKRELMTTLHQLLRGDPEFGVLPKQAPLLPLEMELEIDGTGGIYPGNSFHNSYLPTRYLKETLYQVMGASHKIDSSGWSTTLTGQIRYLPSNSPERERININPPKKQVDKVVDTTPPPQRPYIPIPSAEEDIADDLPLEIIIPHDFELLEVPPPPKKWIELLSTFKGEVWQNMVIYGYKKTTNSEGQNQWVQTGMHKPEWQPLWIYSDGSRYPYKSATIEQTAAGNPGIFRKEYGDLDRPISSKTVRQQYWDANIEAPNETGESVGYDMLHADTLSTIY